MERHLHRGTTVVANPSASAAPDGHEDAVSLHLPVTPQAAASARHAVSDLAEPTDPDAAWRVELLVSELVGNVLRHARGASQVVLKVVRSDGRLRVSVCDDGEGGPVAVQRAGPFAVSGRGLALVEQLAERWGTTRLEPGTCVWFELPLDDECEVVVPGGSSDEVADPLVEGLA